MGDDEEINYMDIGEFIDGGYLQEVNRLFLHPLGLALEVGRRSPEDPWEITGVWDYRDDSEGMNYGPSYDLRPKAEAIEKIRQERFQSRVDGLGYFIQPIDP